MSSAVSTSSVEFILSEVAKLSFSDKLQVMTDLSSLIKKEAKSGVIGKATKKEKKQKDPDAPKRVSSPATKAWRAFVAHLKTTQPDLFEGCSKEPEKLKIAGEYKDEHKDEYEAFQKKFIDSLPEEEKVTSSSAAKAAEPKKEKKEKKDTKEKKESDSKAEALAKVKALASAKKAASSAKAEPKAEEKKEKKPVKKVQGSQGEAVAARRAAEKKVEPPKEDEDDSMAKIEIDGEEYWIDNGSNSLFKIEDDGSFGPLVGTYNPATGEIEESE
jgi:hypothetical protein